MHVLINTSENSLVISFNITENQCIEMDSSQTNYHYIQKSGNIAGESMEQTVVNSIKDCSSLCSKNPECCVYQYSPSEQICELYKECAPNDEVHSRCPKKWWIWWNDMYIFCQKSKYFHPTLLLLGRSPAFLTY